MTHSMRNEHGAAVARYRRISLWVALALALLCLILAWLGGFACLSCQNDPATSVAVPAAASAPAPSASLANAALPAASSGASAAQQGGVAAVAPGASAPVAATTPACGPVMDVTVSFATGSARLTDEGKAQLAGVVKCIAGPTQVSGHSDSLGGQTLNLQLSTARANAAMAYLKQLGVKPEWLSAKGYGSGQPIADNNTEEGRYKNRRIALVAK